ncbi:MAG: GGDEF domain-containing protein [Lachnospiraceae bacterium]|nr:GGDEF domain-containing protein [Lachnospiraceae bacterium]
MENNYKTFRFRVIALFSLIIFLLTIFITAVPMRSSLASLRTSFSELMISNTRQLGSNLDATFGWVEKTASLMFSDKVVYEYDPVANSYTDYQKLQIENEISDLVEQLGIMGNFADFGIVYSNDEHVGWISEKMAAQFVNGGMYDEFAKSIKDENTESGWSFGHSGNYDKFFYSKRINEHAVLMMSFYTAEVDEYFEGYGNVSEKITMSLVDDNNEIIYSNDKLTIGMELDSDITALTSNGVDSSRFNNEYIVTTCYCQNGWRLICSIPQEIITSKTIRIQHFTLIFAALSCIVFLIIANFLYFKMSRPFEGMMTDLNRQANYDSLTNIFNKGAFETEVRSRIKKMKDGDCMGFLMIDMDNFKQINDNLGHEYGDEVIARLGDLLREKSTNDTVIGRLGGDEFAVHFDFSKNSMVSAERTMHDYVDQLLYNFSRKFAEEHRRYGLSLSVGATVAACSMDYDEIYRQADDTMYQSKRTGKNKATYKFIVKDDENDL